MIDGAPDAALFEKDITCSNQERYWIGVVSASHVSYAVDEGIAQTCHGKAGSLRRMRSGDWLIYYSPRTEMKGGETLQAFTAIGWAIDNVVYRYKISDDFIPHRRNMSYLPCRIVKIAGLLDKLTFTRMEQNWGYPFRFGQFEINRKDFLTIANEMLGSSYEETVKEESLIFYKQLEFNW
ncbi:EVE domain-containing protein [Paenibacillus peoriae]|uniref:EVE domain-containing protein n=1 Tax=Paenibacillus peoriae TaxID=59893 RepID=UPI00026C5B2D|nr:EVE domain-containing protein [Paenibacillus peoriae]MEC0184639.1 EVE domain-containing protein [Paenibacillus peoriae]